MRLFIQILWTKVGAEKDNYNVFIEERNVLLRGKITSLVDEEVL